MNFPIPLYAMTTAKAKAVRMPFGNYAGSTLAEIAIEDVLYLDWLCGLHDLNDELRAAVEVMCDLHARAIDKKLNQRG